MEFDSQSIYALKQVQPVQPVQQVQEVRPRLVEVRGNSDIANVNERSASDQSSKKVNFDSEKTEDSTKVSDKEIASIFKQANKKLEGTFTQLSYEVHKPTNMIHVKVIDSDTKDVIREIPPKKILDSIAKMWELVGLIVDEKS